jgi:hypothetical protein
MEQVRLELRDKGYFVPDEGDPTKPINPENNMPYYDTCFLKDGEKIECWWFEKTYEDDNRWYIYDKPRCGNMLRHDFKYYEQLDYFTWKGHNFPIPNQIEEYLVMMYGPSWKTPNKHKKYNDQRKSKAENDL